MFRKHSDTGNEQVSANKPVDSNKPDSANKPKTHRKWLLFAAAIVLFGVAAFLLFRYGNQVMEGKWSVSKLISYMRSLGYWAALIGAALVMLQTLVPFAPFIVLAGANVAVFGLWAGFLITWSGAVTGAILMFLGARTFGRQRAEERLKSRPKWRQIVTYIEKNQFMVIFLFRLFPVIPPTMLNIAAGVSPVSFSAYASATLLGKAPVIFLQTMLSHDVLNFSEYKGRFIVIAIVLLIALLAGTRILRKRMKIPS